MNGASSAVTVLEVLKLASEVIGYIKAVKGADEERRKLSLELTRVTGLLSTVADIAEEVKDDWARAIRTLEGPAGALVVFDDLLMEVRREMRAKTDPKQASQPDKRPASVSILGSSRLATWLQARSISSTTTVAAAQPLPRTKGDAHSTRNGRVWGGAVKADSIVEDLEWPFTRPRLEALLQRLEPIKLHFLVALSGDNVRLSKMIQNELRSVHGDVRAVKDDTAAIREHQDGTRPLTDEVRLIHQALSTFDPTEEISREDLQAIKRTASWVLHHVAFHDWRRDRNTLLLTGGPGTGKTSICRMVENFLRSSSSMNDDSEKVFVVAIYCSYRNRPDNRSLQSVLAFIVHNMLATHNRFQKYYNKLMLTGEGPLKVTDSLRFIHRARQDFDRFYVLLDGLDEYSPEMAQELADKLTSLHVPLQLFVTSRPNPVILGRSFHHNIRMEEESPTDTLDTNLLVEPFRGKPLGEYYAGRYGNT